MHARKPHVACMSKSELHVVLGSGQIGALVAGELLARGDRVRVVRRGPAGAARPGLEWMSGDVSDFSFAETATRGAAVVYDCLSPAYDQWTTLLLPLARGAMHGAATAGAKLVALDNLYMYGRVDGPIRESSPVAPCSRKGELRARLAEERADAHRRGDVRIATGRASDFFGPGVVRQTTYGDRFYKRALAGKKVECLGDPDQPHALAYAPDVARALVTLADHDEAFGAVWHVPGNPAESMRVVVDRLSRALDSGCSRRCCARWPRWPTSGTRRTSSTTRDFARRSAERRPPSTKSFGRRPCGRKRRTRARPARRRRPRMRATTLAEHASRR